MQREPFRRQWTVHLRAREQKFCRRLSPRQPDMPPPHLLGSANAPNRPVKFLKQASFLGTLGPPHLLGPFHFHFWVSETAKPLPPLDL